MTPLVLALAFDGGMALDRRFHLHPIGINHRAERRDRDAEIYRRWDAGESQAALAREFGLSRTRLGGIVSEGIRRDPEAWERERARHPGDGRVPRAKLERAG